ncbi:CRISPR-associated helicase Cas3' [Streptomyces spiramenti]|uniref:CRISPR-associated helicase Cas3 n=1 Tax=Streptomyces spiramenti TaxID=2720606 RepID=A0ABX1AS47_9ACTN|nr:CRISPR-associated helicase Cas3' [Streptomyces spiramenti]NJP67122.1 CRISPR-associated helicase Cas3' [Streptomyces spiramenti]
MSAFGDAFGGGEGRWTALGTLSDAARAAWGKTDQAGTLNGAWLPLWRHMADSGAVAGRLWDEWLPDSIRARIAAALPGGETDGRRLVVWSAASHDIGKATPAFACQVEDRASDMRDVGLRMLTAKEYGDDRKLAPHGLAGQLVMEQWLTARHGVAARSTLQFGVIAGGHHGTPPTHAAYEALEQRPHLLHHRGEARAVWQGVQRELLEGCAELAGVTDRLPHWGRVRLPQPAQVLVTAVVIVSDWIASSPELFPYDSASWQPAGEVGEARRLEAAWRGLDLPAPWRAPEADGSAADLFAARFSFPTAPGGPVVRPVQVESVRIAREMEPAGLLVIEAPMGEGKTEAALAAAEILASRSGAGGCLVALPTRATGDAMFPRLLEWLDRLPLDGPQSVVLAHGKAAFNDTWAGMLRQSSGTVAAVEMEACDDIDARGHGRDQARRRPAGLHAHQWLRGKKKSLLASFAVGTVDQVLFAGLKSRHLALRHLAVAGKVVVIDEVHAYDAYMSRYLDRALAWLAAYRVPVVLLSATLPAGRRAALTAAYAGGGAAVTPHGAGAPNGSGDEETAYPLITAAWPGGGRLTARPAAAAGRETAVAVERLVDDIDLLGDTLADALVDGGCALVVRNTVDRVLEAADALRARFGDENVTVAHSRFVASDRAARDTGLRERFGRDGATRPGLHIVVASQVVEQSLDVDFDLLVTDIAPVDLVLQRIGRLHRHPRSRPPRLRAARCLITGVDWDALPPQAAPGSRAVYGDHALLRSLAVLLPHLDGEPLALPDAISPLVQAAYGDDAVGPGAWQEALATARERHRRELARSEERAGAYLLGPVKSDGRPLLGWLAAGVGDADDSPTGRAQVRDSGENLEVLVVQRLADGSLRTLPWLRRGDGGLSLPMDFPPPVKAAKAVAGSALTLPGVLCHPGAIDRTIQELEQEAFPGWQVKECPWLAGELVLVLDEDCQTRLTGFQLKYDEKDGLRVARPDGSEDDGENTDAY